MPESLTGADGAAVDLDDPAAVERTFAAAQAAPPKKNGTKPDYAAPRKRDPAAPHGRDADGAPLAPHGYKTDGTPRLVPPGPGRPGKGPAAKARVQAKAPDPGPAGAAMVRRAADVTTTLELLSAAGSLLAMLRSSRAVAVHAAAEATGNKPGMAKAVAAQEKAEVMQLDAAACAIHADDVGPAVAKIADNNRLVGALVDRLALFNGVAGVGIAVLPLVYQITANHAPKAARDNLPPQLLQLGVLPPTLLMEKLEAQNALKLAKAQAGILAEKQAAEAELAELRDAA